jgi:apolipoprotein N-acyltransferase
MASSSAVASAGPRWRLASAVASATLFIAAYPVFDQHYLAWLALVPVLVVLDGDGLRARDAVVVGGVFGLVTQLGVMGWVYHALRHGAELPAWGALAGFVGLCALQGAALALWALGVHLARGRRVSVVASAPVLLVLVEWLWPAVFPTFLASTQHRNHVLAQTVELAGPLGLSFLVAWTSAVIYGVLAWRLHRRRSPPIAAGLALVTLTTALLVYGAMSIRDTEDSADHPARTLRLGVVQPGRQHGASDAAVDLRRDREQSVEVIRQGAELVVWPESSYGGVVADGSTSVDPSVLGALGRPVLFGALRHERTEGGRVLTHSSAFLIDAHGEVRGAYDRRHLLAFRDDVPLGRLIPGLRSLLPHGPLLDPGRRVASLELDGTRLAVMLSFEELMPGYVRRLAADGPDLLVSLSDDWLEQGRGLPAQLALATFRAIEHRRFLVRATPRGVSAVIDPTGRVLEATHAGSRANLVVDVPAMEGWTPYELVGDWPGWLALGMVLVWLRPSLEMWLRPLLAAGLRRLSDAWRARARS